MLYFRGYFYFVMIFRKKRYSMKKKVIGLFSSEAPGKLKTK